jgi:hypothetical protein
MGLNIFSFMRCSKLADNLNKMLEDTIPEP